MTLPESLIQRLVSATRVVVLTGAGVSAESGVPTFRDAQTGLWARFKPEELATPEAFQRHPKRVWEWYAWRRERVATIHPNAAHQALAEMEQMFPAFLLVTQNVDGLHQRAGSRAVVELHGNIRRTKCSKEGRVVPTWRETGEVPPRCPRCGGLLRPDVVWFGEMLPEAAFARALTEAERCEVMLSIGTSSLVYPAAMLPQVALEARATVVEINPESSPLTARADVVLSGNAGVVVPEVVNALKLALGNRAV